jgi:CheY-like chemotaxis protein
MKANRLESRQVQRTKEFRRQSPLPLDPDLRGAARVNAFAEFQFSLTGQRSIPKVSDGSGDAQASGTRIREYCEHRPLPRLVPQLELETSLHHNFSMLAARVSVLEKEGIMPLPINILIVCAKNEEQVKLAEMVRSTGMRAIVCTNIQEARSILEKQEINALITEEILPDGSYRDVIHQRGRDSEEFPVIVFSDSGDWDAYLRVMRTGAFDCVAYPPDSTELARVLWQALRQAKQHHEMAITAV